MRKHLIATATSPVTSATKTGAAATIDREELWDVSEVCAFFGNVHPSTLYRGIAAGRFPRPVKIGLHANRWLASECLAARAAMVAARGGVSTTARP